MVQPFLLNQDSVVAAILRDFENADQRQMDNSNQRSDEVDQQPGNRHKKKASDERD